MVGSARPERVFSVGHTGGDLSLPDDVKAKVMPKPFPILEEEPGVLDHIGQRDEPAAPAAPGEGAEAQSA